MDVLQQLGLEVLNQGACSGAGAWFSGGGVHLSSFNPATEELLGKVVVANAENYEQIIQASHAAFLKWREVPAPKRGEIIRQMGNALREKKDALGSLVAMEMGKSKQEGDGEVQEMIDIADFAVGQSRMLYGLTMHSERPKHRMYEQWHPYGMVGVISAFNFPVAVWAWNAFIAAICGNTTIWKPASKTPLCAVAVQHICNEVMQANECAGIFSLFIASDNQVAQKLVDDPRVPLVSFTGSTGVGRNIAAAVAQRLGHSILELGGNNAIIVDETADLKLTVPAIVFGATGTAGQRCTTTRRLFVQENMYTQLVPQLVNAYQQVTIGDPIDVKNLMGPLVDRVAVDAYLAAIAKAKEAGGEVLFGGEAIEGKGHFVQPCMIKAENHYAIVQEETFAPILYVMTYKDLEEAIALHNGVKQGLSSAMFTNHIKHAERFLSAVGSDCGIANINIGTSGAEIGGAFGGEKDTGGGRESGSDAWKAYMRRQTNTINWSDELPLAQGIEFGIGI